jgi:hypothetical protein
MVKIGLSFINLNPKKMKKHLLIIGIVLFLFAPKLNANNNEVSFTLQDRDRITRTEQKLDFLITGVNSRFESVDKQFESVDKRFDAVDKRFDAVDRRFDSVDKRFDQLFNFLWAIIGIFTSMFIAMLGFAFWDRKLSLAPIKRDNERLLTALRDYAKHQPKLSEILRNAGLL